jgi:hypothetical protein
MIGGDNPQTRLLNDPFFKFFRTVQGPSGAVGYERRLSLPPSMSYQEVQKRDKGVTQEAADIYKEKTGRAYGGKIMTPKEPEVEPEAATLGKSESELSRRERLRRRRDASFKFAALQKQGGKAQLGA